MSEAVVSLADRLKARREELGLSQAQAARELDVARTAYRLWEMEAAKPSPDRWRLIARWLGVSVATMLLADDVIERDEATLMEEATRLDGHGELEVGGDGDFFSQGRAVTREAVRGGLTPTQESDLGTMYDRLERGWVARQTSAWPVASITKTIEATPLAPSEAREAMRFAAASVPEDRRDDLKLLVSEAVTLTLREDGAGNGALHLRIDVGRTTVRAEISQATPTTAFPIDPEGPHRFAVIVLASIASRWGAGRVGDANVTWFEVDVPLPGVGSDGSSPGRT